MSCKQPTHGGILIWNSSVINSGAFYILLCILSLSRLVIAARIMFTGNVCLFVEQSSAPESQSQSWALYVQLTKLRTSETGVHVPSVFQFRQRKHFVVVRKRLWFQLNVNKHVLSPDSSSADFFCIKLHHNISKCCQCLNITIKKCKNVMVPAGGYCIARSDILPENEINAMWAFSCVYKCNFKDGIWDHKDFDFEKKLCCNHLGTRPQSTRSSNMSSYNIIITYIKTLTPGVKMKTISSTTGEAFVVEHKIQTLSKKSCHSSFESCCTPCRFFSLSFYWENYGLFYMFYTLCVYNLRKTFIEENYMLLLLVKYRLCRFKGMSVFRFVFSGYSDNIFLSMTHNKSKASYYWNAVNSCHLCFLSQCLLPHLLKSKLFNFMLLSSAYICLHLRYF